MISSSLEFPSARRGESVLALSGSPALDQVHIAAFKMLQYSRRFKRMEGHAPAEQPVKEAPSVSFCVRITECSFLGIARSLLYGIVDTCHIVSVLRELAAPSLNNKRKVG